LFFRSERSIMLGVDAPNEELECLKKRVHCKTHGKIGFAEMARVIGARWKSLDPQQRKVFELQALKEKKRYKLELASWKEGLESSSRKIERQGGVEATASAALQSAEVNCATTHHREVLEEDRSTSRFLVDHGTAGPVSSTSSVVDLIRSQKRSMLPLPQPTQMPLAIVDALHDRRAGLPLLDLPLLGYPHSAPLPASALRRHLQFGSDAGLLCSTAREAQILEINRLSRMLNSYYPSNQGLPGRQLPYLGGLPYGFDLLHER
jgi:hypothetical protein